MGLVSFEVHPKTKPVSNLLLVTASTYHCTVHCCNDIIIYHSWFRRYGSTEVHY